VAAPDINQSFVVQGRPEDVQTRLLAVVGTDGYQLLGQTHGGLGLRRRRIPVWAIVLAVAFFPFGLLLLLVKTEETVTVAVERAANGTQISIHGRASPGLQRALQAALGAWQVAGAPAPRWPDAGVGMPPPAPPGYGAAPPPPPAPEPEAANTPAAGFPAIPPVPVGYEPPPTAATEGAPTEAVPSSGWEPPPGWAPPSGAPPAGGAPPSSGEPPPSAPWQPPAPPMPPFASGSPGGAPPMPLGPIGGPPGGATRPPAAPPGGLAPLDLPDVPKLDLDPPRGPDRG
jgi:hypothetical protein